MSKKPSDKKASEAATDAHSADPAKRKEAMATLRDRKGKGGESGKGKSSAKSS